MVIFIIIDSQAETSEAENSSTSSSSHIARPELRDVLMKLFPVADKWENIGIMVGIEPDKLNAVKEGNYGRPFVSEYVGDILFFQLQASP